MKVVVAVDSFKGSVSSMEANSSVVNAIRSVSSEISILSFPIADGGEGSLQALKDALNGDYVFVNTLDL